ncbi:MAG: glutaredoxin family protein [Gammaproteobacteria bacterium]
MPAPVRRLTLYSRPWCELCEQMEAALRRISAQCPFVLEVVDVDSDPESARRWGRDVPVLLAGEQELCRHRLDRAVVDAWLRS